ncbi:MAG: nitroreductase family protein [Muricomes sp.]
MNVIECIRGRRSIRKYKPDPVSHSLIDSIVSAASYSPSWKNTQITRYIAIEDSFIIGKIASDFVSPSNAKTLSQAPMLIAVSVVKGLSGLDGDGNYATKKKDGWDMFDAGVACQSFCLAAKDHGLGTVIMGIFDEDKVSELLGLPENQELAALIAVGYPDIDPEAPERKPVEELLQYK